MGVPCPGPLPRGNASQSAWDGSCGSGEASTAFLVQEALIGPLRARVGVPCPEPPFPGRCISKCTGWGRTAWEGPCPGPLSLGHRIQKCPGWYLAACGGFTGLLGLLPVPRAPLPGARRPKVPGTGSRGPREASPAFLGQEALIGPLRARGGSPLPQVPFPLGASFQSNDKGLGS